MFSEVLCFCCWSWIYLVVERRLREHFLADDWHYKAEPFLQSPTWTRPCYGAFLNTIWYTYYTYISYALKIPAARHLYFLISSWVSQYIPKKDTLCLGITPRIANSYPGLHFVGSWAKHDWNPRGCYDLWDDDPSIFRTGGKIYGKPQVWGFFPASFLQIFPNPLIIMFGDEIKLPILRLPISCILDGYFTVVFRFNCLTV